MKMKSFPSLARDPEPVRDDDIRLTALKRHFGSWAARHALNFQFKPVGFVESVMLDAVEFPVHGSVLKHGGAQNGRFRYGGRCAYNKRGRRHANGGDKAHDVLPKWLQSP